MALLLRAAPLVLLAACAFSDPGAPRDVRLGKARDGTNPGTCPPVAGTYRVAANTLSQVIRQARLSEHGNAPWEYLTVVQAGDTLLRFVYHGQGQVDTTVLRALGDFSCNSGWIEANAAWGRPYPAERDPNKPRTIRQEFRIASTRSGALVGQLIVREFEEVVGRVPMPGTARRAVSYSELADSASPAGSVTSDRASQRRDAIQERLAREEAEKEGRPPSPAR